WVILLVIGVAQSTSTCRWLHNLAREVLVAEHNALIQQPVVMLHRVVAEESQALEIGGFTHLHLEILEHVVRCIFESMGLLQVSSPTKVRNTTTVGGVSTL